MRPLNIFIGWDSKEPVAFQVLSHSLLTRSSIPISITPIVLGTFGVYKRERGPLESTEFSMTRFLVPYLSGYSGYSVFMDCDMLCRTNIAELMAETIREPGKAVWVCKHDYEPKESVKFLGQTQTKYPRKNWSSLMIFDNEKCSALTPEYINTATGLELHRFQWLEDDQIGSIPLEWNWLVGEYEPNPDAKMLHYTLGGPWFGYDGPEWYAELEKIQMERVSG